MEQFDANGDGQLDEQERTAARKSRRAKILKHFDTDGNGVLDDDEKKTARKARWHHRKRQNRQDRQDRQRRVTPGSEA